MEFGGGFADDALDPAIHIKDEVEAGVVPRSGAPFCGLRELRGLRGLRRLRDIRRERGETARPPVVTDHPRAIKKEVPRGDGEVRVDIRVGCVMGRCVTADEASETTEKKEKKRKLQTDWKALTGGVVTGKVELQMNGNALIDSIRAGEVGRKAGSVDGADTSGFPSFETKLEELLPMAVDEVAEGVARDAEPQADEESLVKTSAEIARDNVSLRFADARWGRRERMPISKVEEERAKSMAARRREALKAEIADRRKNTLLRLADARSGRRERTRASKVEEERDARSGRRERTGIAKVEEERAKAMTARRRGDFYAEMAEKRSTARKRNAATPTTARQEPAADTRTAARNADTATRRKTRQEAAAGKRRF